MFSQEEINDWVSLDIVFTFVVIAALSVFFIYKWIDYKIFLHKIHKKTENKPWP